MKAIVYSEFGTPDVLKCVDLKTPTPGDNEVLIRVRSTSANPLDWHLMKGRPYVSRIILGFRRPRTKQPGRDVAGHVEAIGKSVVEFKPGDAVFGVCRGAFAEYARAPRTALVIKPDHVSFEQAASAPIAALTALQGLRDKAKIQAGQKVLVNGAGGGVGTFAVQIAKWFGAEVTGVCSTSKVELVRSIGADHVVDYTRQDFTERGQLYDVIYDTVANHSMSARRRALTHNGICVMVAGPNESRSMTGLMGQLAAGLILSPFMSRKVVVCVARMNRRDLALIGELMASRKVTPVIGRRYGLAEAAEAVRYVATGHALGKAVINIE